MPGDLRQLVQDFDVADPEGDAFRYAADSSVHESCCVDPDELRRGLTVLEDHVREFLAPLGACGEPGGSCAPSAPAA
jgi:hypothetical protein